LVSALIIIIFAGGFKFAVPMEGPGGGMGRMR
jgi:hypothetical protein